MSYFALCCIFSTFCALRFLKLVVPIDVVFHGRFQQGELIKIVRISHLIPTKLYVTPRPVATEVPGMCPFRFVFHGIPTVGDLLTSLLHSVTLPAALVGCIVAVMLK